MTEIKMAKRHKLIDKIKTLDDEDILNEIYRLLEINFEDAIYITDKEQKEAIHQARVQIKQGKGIPSKKADKEIDQWLKE